MQTFQVVIQAIIVIGGGVLLALFGAFHVRRRVSLEVQMEQNEVVGFFIAVLGAVYGVLLAFAVILVWEQYADAKVMAENEANSLGDVYNIAIGVSEPTRSQIHQATLAYASIVIDDEWASQSDGVESRDAWLRLEQTWQLVRQFEPNGPREQALQQSLLTDMDDLTDARRMRLLAARDGVPRLVWSVLIGGAVVTVLFTYFFGLKNFRAQLAMTALYVASIGFVLFLVAAIDYPYTGIVSTGPEAMTLVLERIKTLEEAGY
jgi:hypothetical protein